MLIAFVIFAVLIALWGMSSRSAKAPGDPSGPEAA
jgi:hypothetical protein